MWMQNYECGPQTELFRLTNPRFSLHFRVFTGLVEMGTRMSTANKQAKIAVIMGSNSDWPTMQACTKVLDELEVAYDTRIVSAHRTPDRLVKFAKSAKSKGIDVIIAGAGGAAHLPGMVASMTSLPVLGVPIESKALNGMDSLLSIAQMPGGVPVGTLAIGSSGAKNAGLLAASILALHDTQLAHKLENWRALQTKSVANTPNS